MTGAPSIGGIASIGSHTLTVGASFSEP